jgi:hypothetical protein
VARLVRWRVGVSNVIRDVQARRIPRGFRHVGFAGAGKCRGRPVKTPRQKSKVWEKARALIERHGASPELISRVPSVSRGRAVDVSRLILGVGVKAGASRWKMELKQKCLGRSPEQFCQKPGQPRLFEKLTLGMYSPDRDPLKTFRAWTHLPCRRNGV